MSKVKPLHRELSEGEIEMVAGGNFTSPTLGGGDCGNGTGPKDTYDGQPEPKKDCDVGTGWKWKL